MPGEPAFPVCQRQNKAGMEGACEYRSIQWLGCDRGMSSRVVFTKPVAKEPRKRSCLH